MAGIAVLLASLHRVLPLVITSDPAVIDGTQRVVPIVAFMLIGDGMNACMSGVVRGCGQQVKGTSLSVIAACTWCSTLHLARSGKGTRHNQAPTLALLCLFR